MVVVGSSRGSKYVVAVVVAVVVVVVNHNPPQKSRIPTRKPQFLQGNHDFHIRNPRFAEEVCGTNLKV